MTSSQLTGKWGKNCLHATTCSKLLEAVNTKLREFLDEQVRVLLFQLCAIPLKEEEEEENCAEKQMIKNWGWFKGLLTHPMCSENTQRICFSTGVQLCVEQMARLSCYVPSLALRLCPGCTHDAPPDPWGVDLGMCLNNAPSRLWHKAQMAGHAGGESCCLVGDFLPIGVPAVARVWAGKSHLPETMLLISLFVPTAVTLYGFFKKKKKVFIVLSSESLKPIHASTNTVLGKRSNFSNDGTKLISLSSISEIFVFSLSLPPTFYPINQREIVWMHG